MATWRPSRSLPLRLVLIRLSKGFAAVMPWWGALQALVVQIRHCPGQRPAWHQPSGAPWQRRPAIGVVARSFSHGATLARPPDPPQPLQLHRQRPGAVLQVLQLGVAVERPPVDATRPATPVTGLRGARTSVVGLGPATAVAALVDPRAGLDADLPEPARLPPGHQVSPPLAWLPGSDQPTKHAGTAKPEPHGAHPSYSLTLRPAGHGLGVEPATRRRNGRRTLSVALPMAGWHSNEPVRRLGATRP
jgi:hypothetical protein